MINFPDSYMNRRSESRFIFSSQLNRSFESRFLNAIYINQKKWIGKAERDSEWISSSRIFINVFLWRNNVFNLNQKKTIFSWNFWFVRHFSGYIVSAILEPLSWIYEIWLQIHNQRFKRIISTQSSKKICWNKTTYFATQRVKMIIYSFRRGYRRYQVKFY